MSVKRSAIALFFISGDVFLSRHIAALPSSLSQLFHWIGLVARPIAWIAVALTVVAIMAPLNQGLAALALSVAAATLLSSVLKLIFRRQRPVTIYTKAMKIKSFSFPSSHSYAAALGCTFLGVFTYVLAPSSLWATAAPLAVIAVTIGISRVYVGAHYPSDVIGGMALGCAVGLLLPLMYGVY